MSEPGKRDTRVGVEVVAVNQQVSTRELKEVRSNLSQFVKESLLLIWFNAAMMSEVVRDSRHDEVDAPTDVLHFAREVPIQDVGIGGFIDQQRRQYLGNVSYHLLS